MELSGRLIKHTLEVYLVFILRKTWIKSQTFHIN